MFAAGKATIDELVDWEPTYFYGTLETPGKLQKKLAGIGYNSLPQVTTKKGAWEICLREHYVPKTFLQVPGKESKPEDSTVAFYHSAKGHGKIRGLFMTRQGFAVNPDELKHNALTMSSDVIERRGMRAAVEVTGPAILMLAGYGLVLGSEYIRPSIYHVFASHPPIIVGISIVSFVVGPLLSSKAYDLFQQRRNANSFNKLINPSAYFYGAEAVNSLLGEFEDKALNEAAESAYSSLLSLGSIKPDRAAFWEKFLTITNGLRSQNFGERLEELAKIGETPFPLKQFVNAIAPYRERLTPFQ